MWDMYWMLLSNWEIHEMGFIDELSGRVFLMEGCPCIALFGMLWKDR